MSESVVIIERISDPFNQPARCISISYVKLTSSGGLSMDDIGLGSPDQTFLAFGEGGFEVPHSGNTFCPFHLERLVTKTAKGPVMTVVEAGDALVAERRRLRRADHYIQQRCPKKHVPDPSTTMIHARTYVPLTFSLPAPTENKNNVVPVPKASQASSCFHDDECATATTKASNVPGPAFINVHRTLDPYADVVRAIETSVVAVSYDGGGCLDMETLGIGEPDDMFVAFDLNNKLRPGPYFPNGRYMYCIFDHVRYEHEDDLNPTLTVISHDDLIVAQEHHYQERKARERALKREARSKWLASIAPWAIFATSHGAEHEAKPRFASLPVTEDSSTAEHQGGCDPSLNTVIKPGVVDFDCDEIPEDKKCSPLCQTCSIGSRDHTNAITESGIKRLTRRIRTYAVSVCRASTQNEIHIQLPEEKHPEDGSDPEHPGKEAG